MKINQDSSSSVSPSSSSITKLVSWNLENKQTKKYLEQFKITTFGDS